jgi:hypothetical protein
MRGTLLLRRRWDVSEGTVFCVVEGRESWHLLAPLGAELCFSDFTILIFGGCAVIRFHAATRMVRVGILEAAAVRRVSCL